jgi:hypothetical protein
VNVLTDEIRDMEVGPLIKSSTPLHPPRDNMFRIEGLYCWTNENNCKSAYIVGWKK